MIYNDLKRELSLYADFEKANILQRFFKTVKGQYGEGDIFLGVVVPNTRKVAKKYTDLPLSEVKKVLYSRIHEERLCALLILVEKFVKANKISISSLRAERSNPGKLKSNKNTLNSIERQKIFNFYIKNAKQANNWDLVDLSAPKIVGEYLLNHDPSTSLDKARDESLRASREVLYKFAVSKNLWERRIAILSTFTFIKNGEYNDSLKIAEILLNDEHDLIHKAVGWMLREVGKKSIVEEEKFLKKYHKIMPRTMLRYAIEKFPENVRLKYLKGYI